MTSLAAADITRVQLASNQCRFSLGPMEEAGAYDSYLRSSGSTATRLASLIGKSEAHISRTRALVGIKDEIQELVASGKLGPSLALELDRVSNPTLYAALMHRAQSGSLTRAELIKANASKPAARASTAPAKSARSPSPRLMIPLGKGCSLTVSSTVRSISQMLELLQDLVDRVRQARDQACDDVTSLASILRQAPSA